MGGGGWRQRRVPCKLGHKVGIARLQEPLLWRPDIGFNFCLRFCYLEAQLFHLFLWSRKSNMGFKLPGSKPAVIKSASGASEMAGSSLRTGWGRRRRRMLATMWPGMFLESRGREKLMMYHVPCIMNLAMIRRHTCKGYVNGSCFLVSPGRKKIDSNRRD